jgi:hypothetical protein
MKIISCVLVHDQFSIHARESCDLQYKNTVLMLANIFVLYNSSRLGWFGSNITLPSATTCSPKLLSLIDTTEQRLVVAVGLVPLLPMVNSTYECSIVTGDAVLPRACM